MSIRGEKKKEFLTTDEILDRTNGGKQIFILYLGKISKLMSRPWGKKETKDSWSVFSKNGIWWYKDFATEEAGTAIEFVQKYFSLSFKDAINKICKDFGWEGNEPLIIIPHIPQSVEREHCEIAFTSQSFLEQHHKFWNAAEISEEHCKKYNCFAVKDLSINKRRMNIGEKEPVFAYWCEEENRVKIYFPEREKNKRFKNSVSWHHLWNYNKLENCESLIVQKSMKDLIVTTMIEPCCIATQAEAVKIFDEEVVKKINSISKSAVIWYGSDWDGVKKCKEITDANKWRYINTPKSLLPEINDAFGYACKYGIKGLEEFMKSKKLIK